MPRAKNKSRKIGATPLGLMKEVVEQIIKNKASTRKVSEEYAIPFTTLWRYVCKYKFFEHSTDVVFEPRYNCRKVFSDAEETMLKDYFIKASKFHHGFSAKFAWELAYQFTIKVNKSFPSNWEKNKSAGKDFLKRFLELSLRKPEAISLARATLFNKINVSSFFDKLEECLKRASYSLSDIYNADDDDDDDDDILFMLSNIIKYMQCTVLRSMKRKCDTTTNVKHAESIERVEKEKK